MSPVRGYGKVNMTSEPILCISCIKRLDKKPLILLRPREDPISTQIKNESFFKSHQWMAMKITGLVTLERQTP